MDFLPNQHTSKGGMHGRTEGVKYTQFSKSPPNLRTARTPPTL